MYYYFITFVLMTAEKKPLTTSDKIENSPWKKKKIMELLDLYPNKFATKMKYNDWDEKEIAALKKKGAIE